MNNNSQIGGILSIVSGAIGVLGAIVLFFFTTLFGAIFTDPYFGVSDGTEVLPFIATIYGGMGVILLIFSVVAIIGGVYALKKKLWGMVLAGAICGLLAFWPTGIAAIILISIGKNEFNKPTLPPSSVIS
jgi:hypothetical protein